MFLRSNLPYTRPYNYPLGSDTHHMFAAVPGLWRHQGWRTGEAGGRRYFLVLLLPLRTYRFHPALPVSRLHQHLRYTASSIAEIRAPPVTSLDSEVEVMYTSPRCRRGSRPRHRHHSSVAQR